MGDTVLFLSPRRADLAPVLNGIDHLRLGWSGIRISDLLRDENSMWNLPVWGVAHCEKWNKGIGFNQCRFQRRRAYPPRS